MKKHDEMTLKIAEIVFEKGDQLIEQNKKKSAKIRHISYAVSGICAAVIVGISVLHFSSSAPKMNKFNNSSDIIASTDTTTEKNNTTASAITETTSTETTHTHSTVSSTAALKTTALNKTTEITETTSAVTEIAETSESTIENTTTENITTQPQSSVITEPIVTTEDSATTVKTVTKITSTTSKPVTRITTTTTTPITITTSTITTNKVEEGKFTAVIHIYDEETGEAIPDINVQFIEYESDWQTASDQPAEIVKVLAEWNTADTNPMVIENIDFVQGHFYAVKIDEFPEGYCYSWQDHIVTGIHGDGIFKGVKNYNLAVSHHKPFPTLEYPLDINREFTFSIVDMSTNEVVEGLDVELAQLDFDPEIVNKYNYSKTLDTWNTSDDPVHSITIPMHFDSENTSPYLWGIKINNMPEGYRYRLPDHDGYYVDGGYSVGDYKYDLYSEKNVTEYKYSIHPESYKPVYVTTVSSPNAATTTTTTAVTATAEGEKKDCTAKVKFAFIDQLSGIPISGLDVTVSKDGTELFKFNTTDTPEIVKEINYSADMNTSAIYTLEIKGLPEKYGYENNAIRRSLCLDASNNGKIVDNTLIIASIDMGYTDQVVLEDPTFGFYKKVFYLKTDSEKIIPFSNTDNVKVTATLDTTEAEIIETTEKYVILKADNSCSGTLTVTDENGRSIITKFQITKPKEYTTGTMTTTVPGTTTTTTQTTAVTRMNQTEPIKGDANCDGILNMSDAVLIMQSIANPAKYGVKGSDSSHITEQGMKNSDITGNNDGVTNADALAIQKKLLKLE